MKNYQQTPRQRRASLAKAKTVLQNQRNQPFQPRTRKSSKQKLGGVYVETLEDTQRAGGHLGFDRGWGYRWFL